MPTLSRLFSSVYSERTIALSILFWTLAISAPYWILGDASFVRIQDNADANFPQRVLTATLFLQGELGSWLPHITGGRPTGFLQMYDNFLFDFVAFAILPPWAAYGSLMILQRLVAAAGMYLLCRKHLNFGRLNAFFVAACFSLGEWSVNDWTLYDGLAIHLAPWLILALSYSRTLSTLPRIGVCAVLGIFTAACSPAVNDTSYLLGFLLLWGLFLERDRLGGYLMAFAVFSLFTVAAEIPYLASLYQYATDSARVQQNVSSAPDAFVLLQNHLTAIWDRDLSSKWIMLLLFAMGAGFASQRMRRQAINVALMFIAIIILARTGNLITVVLRDLSSLFNAINPSELLKYLWLVAPIMAGIGLSGLVRLSSAYVPKALALVTRAIKSRYDVPHLQIDPKLAGQLVAAAAICVPGYAGAQIALEKLDRLPYDSYCANFCIDAFTQLPETEQPYRVATASAFSGETYRNSGRNIHPSYVWINGIETIDAHVSFNARRFTDVWAEVTRPVIDLDESLQRRGRKLLEVWPYLYGQSIDRRNWGQHVPVADYYSLPLLAFLNVEFVLSDRTLTDPSLEQLHDASEDALRWQDVTALPLFQRLTYLFQNGAPSKAVHLYRNTNSFPRAFLAKSLCSYSDEKKLLAEMGNASLDKLASQVFVVDTDDRSQECKTPSTETLKKVRISEYANNHMTIETWADVPSILVISNNNDGRWRARTGQQSLDIFTANHSFLGMHLDPGPQTIFLDRL